VVAAHCTPAHGLRAIYRSSAYFRYLKCAIVYISNKSILGYMESSNGSQTKEQKSWTNSLLSTTLAT
jgi:hypothetical protein